MILWIEVLGIIAGIFTTSGAFPQIIKIFKTKKTRDISLGLIIVFLIGISLWLVYGILIMSYALIISNIAALSLWLIMLYFKLKYK